MLWNHILGQGLQIQADTGGDRGIEVTTRQDGLFC